MTSPSPIVPQRHRGVMLILSSPSGAGKTTLSRRLFETTPQVQMSISVTTRPRRPAEISGRDYHFIDRETFDRHVENGDLLEQAEVYGYFYGTPKTPVLRALESGIDVLFDIDWQGTQQILRQFRADLVTIFILPPSMAELERRLRTRAQDSTEVVAKRMAKAYEDVSHWQKYDYILVNEDIEISLARVCAILAAERLKRERQIDLQAFVAALQAERPSLK